VVPWIVGTATASAARGDYASLRSAPAPAELIQLLGDRIPRIPPMRQVLRRTPVGCGRPVWVDDPSFTVDRHVEVLDRPDHDLLAVAPPPCCVDRSIRSGRCGGRFWSAAATATR